MNEKDESSMQTIIILLYLENLENPDTDLRYDVSDRIEIYTDGKIMDNGYDYLEEGQMVVYLQTEQAKILYPLIVELFQKEEFCGNDLSKSAEIYISEKKMADISECTQVFS